ncbi:MAG: amino acid adenylation domain-containing protein, partial [Synergistaceae bacterium]|nr:amino acid adenylation domain-containing protein [Synergistaceae bacterium]
MYKLTKPQKLIYDMERFVGDAVAVVCGSAIRDGYQDIAKLKATVNALYRLNDALRTRIVEQNGEIKQTIVDFTEQDIEELYFANKAELDKYAENYTKQPINISGNLCEVKVVQLPEQYGFIIKVHHIIGDAWTLSLFASQFYAILDGETPVAYPYKEYADSEVAYLQSKRYEKDSAFFLEQFKKCDEITYLSDKQTNSLISVRKTFEINREKSRYIYNYAQEHHTSPFTLFATALSVYINRVKMNAEKFYIGTAILNRSGVREKNTMGMFINTVPMLIELNNEQTFLQNLTSVETSAFLALRHQKYNYGDVLEDIRKKYNFNRRLYDVIISYQNAKITGNAESTWYHNGVQVESLQIHIDDRDSDEFFKFQYDYQIEKFTEQDIERLHQNICNLLFDAIANDSRKLYELELLSSDERQKLLIDFNDTVVDYPKDKCVHTLFEEQVMKTPDKTAVIACDRTLTYDELNKQANRIAHKLIAKNIGRGDIVAIKLTRKSYLISAMLGVLKTAAAYMPLDPTYPQERIEYMLHESNAKYAIGEENISELLKNENDNNPNIYVSHDDVFCALHTSGSTGEPKLSLLLHGGMNNFIIASKRFWNRIDTVVSTTIVTFDAFQMDTILSVAQGVQLVLSDENEIYSQNDFEKLFLYSKSNMFFSTPTKIENYIDNSINFSYLDRIKSFIIGGEIFNESLLNRIMSHSLESSIFNIYGPTETTICVLVDSLDKTTKEITLGKPISNTKIYIIDKYLKPVPIGVTGELCIAGDGVGAGYLNRPELTAEKFIDNPFGKGKLYRTGDLAYWRDDGNIVYVGRNDFQVKIRGLRIELGEIENAISAIDGIVQSVVIVRKDNTGRQIICAFYTGKEFPAKEIREIIGQKLPKYMLPHIFTHLEKMPLTPSGKISRKSLPDVDLSQIITTTEYIEPENELEIRLAALMEKVLEYSPIGRNDDFFELGFDSLKAIMFTSIAHNDGINFNLQNVFDYPTIRLLAEYINDENKQQISYANFDFTEINKILTKNTIENIQTPQAVSVGNILLTGATGFLGSHILSDYLECDSGIAYCLVRGKNQAESERRLTEILEFYFGKKYNDCERIQVICADLQDERFGLTELGYKNLSSCVNTVINAAATVKHYGSYSYFHSVNVETVTRLIDFCVSSDAKLIHISTESVSGNDSVEDFIRYDNVRSKIFYASDLYIGQNLENVYALSK